MKALLSIPLSLAFVFGPAWLENSIPQDLDFMPALVAGVEFFFSALQ